jgi:hypothetical protein
VLLKSETFVHYVSTFNAMEDENVVNAVPNARSWDWMRQNVPLFACPDPAVEELYYYRWWTYRKHLKETPAGTVVTEFLTPVKHAGAFNTISCALGHHIAEGRWLRDGRFLNDYIRFWYRGEGGKPQPHFHKFSSWAPTAIYERYLTNGDRRFVVEMLDDLVADYRVWEQERLGPDGLFWQFDVRDGMEESISGSRTAQNPRPTINSYMYGNARAIAEMARLANQPDRVREFERKAADLKQRVQKDLWDASSYFYKVRLIKEDKLSDAREAIGFLPWRFGLPASGEAWRQFTDPAGFNAPYGLTTAERRHPKFRTHGCCKCEWDGAVWPFTTSQTLDALAVVLRSDEGSVPVTRRNYFDAFMTYVRSQRKDGKPYIGEYLDESNGRWLKGDERSRYYNHSTFNDLVIAGVVGLVPRADDTIEVAPLLPNGGTWEWFCLDDVPYKGRLLTILWDATGRHFEKGAGLQVFADGERIAQSPRLTRVMGRPRKAPQNKLIS